MGPFLTSPKPLDPEFKSMAEPMDENLPDISAGSTSQEMTSNLDVDIATSAANVKATSKRSKERIFSYTRKADKIRQAAQLSQNMAYYRAGSKKSRNDSKSPMAFSQSIKEVA